MKPTALLGMVLLERVAIVWRDQLLLFEVNMTNHICIIIDHKTDDQLEIPRDPDALK